jgi:hypothetical protein
VLEEQAGARAAGGLRDGHGMNILMLNKLGTSKISETKGGWARARHIKDKILVDKKPTFFKEITTVRLIKRFIDNLKSGIALHKVPNNYREVESG